MTAPMAPAPPPLPSDPAAWYGSINYLLNISAAGVASCLLFFLLVNLRAADHRSFPGLAAKLRSAYHASAAHIARHCGADAAQFLRSERSLFLSLLPLSLLALLAALPLNLYCSSANPVTDQFSRTTIPSASPLLWLHFLLMVIIVCFAHFAISKIEGHVSSHTVSSLRDISSFTVAIHGIPKALAADKAPLEEYLRQRYPDKVFRVVVPFDLCTLDELVDKWSEVQDEIPRLQAKLDDTSPGEGLWVRLAEGKLSRLQKERLAMESKFMEYKAGRAPGAGIGFVVFRDAYTANTAVREFRAERKNWPVGRFFPLMELQLERSRWRVEMAPPASDIYWSHLGLSKLSLRLRRVAVNACLLVMLLFCSSPLAVVNAMKSAARIINAEAMDSAELWWAWIEGSSWFGTVFLQFMPNVLIFVSMYIIVPSALSYLSKFEKHLTVSGEQCAALLKMVCFFLVNLILLRAMLESSLESAILHMGRCYLDGEDCKRIEEYMSPSFLSRSCLSSLAFLITCTFLGISVDLLAPVPWIKKAIRRFRKNDMLQLVPEQNEDFHLEQITEENDIREPLVAERQDTLILNGVEGHDLPVYPVNKNFHVPKQSFDFAQYYAFNLTIFALTMIYCLFAPLVVPVGAIYFGYRYMVDKYNFLFVYRHRGFPSGNDGKLIDRVLCIMRFCVVLFLLAMLLFFSVNGDSMKLQAIFTLGLLFFYKLLPSRTNKFQPSILEGMQSVDSFVDGPTDYEILSQPDVDWDVYRH